MNTETQISDSTQNTPVRTEGVQVAMNDDEAATDLQLEVNFYRFRVEMCLEPDSYRAYLLLKLVWLSTRLPDCKHIDNLAEAKKWAEEAAFLLTTKRRPHARSNWANAHLQLGHIVSNYPIDFSFR